MKEEEEDNEEEAIEWFHTNLTDFHIENVAVDRSFVVTCCVGLASKTSDQEERRIEEELERTLELRTAFPARS